MNSENHCPKCQRTLPADGPSGLCPTCLLAVGLGMPAKQDELNFSPVPTTPSGKQFPPPTSAELAPLFPHLEILDILGQGGMGTVYKAKQRKLDRLVALKIVRSDAAADPAFAERFNREARTLARMSHPNIVAVHDFGEVQTQGNDAGYSQPLFYFVMEFVDGTNLRQLMNGQRLEPDQALAIVPQVCEALQYAHDEGVVHRDIKPENILVDHRGRVKIADFGLAKLVAGSSDDFTLTGTQQIMGTPRYMAPEQMEGSRAVDHRADIYSLGVVFYEMLTGQIPAGHFDPPSHTADVDHRLDSIVLKAMARDPDRRFQRASAVKMEVEYMSASPEKRSEKRIIDPVDAVGGRQRPSPQTVSEFLSYEAAATVCWFTGMHSKVSPIPMTIRGLSLVLCIVAIVALFHPWIHVYVTDRDALSGVESVQKVVIPQSNLIAVSRYFTPVEYANGAIAGVSLVILFLSCIVSVGAKPASRKAIMTQLVLAGFCFFLIIIFRQAVGYQHFVVYNDPDTGELPRHYVGNVQGGSGSAYLNMLEHQSQFLPAAWIGLSSVLGVLVISALSLQYAVPTAPALQKAKSPRASLTPFELSSRLLTVMGVTMLLAGAVGGFLGLFAATVVTSQSQLEQARLMGAMIMALLAGNVVLGTCAFISGRLIQRGEWVTMSRVVCVIVLLFGNVTLPITGPLAIWCLVALSRIQKDYDFRNGKTSIRIVDGNTLMTVRSLPERMGFWLQCAAVTTVFSAVITITIIAGALDSPFRVGQWNEHLLVSALLIQGLCIPLAVLTFIAANSPARDGRLRSRLVQTTCILLLFPWTPGWLFTLPVAAWCLSMLDRQDA